MKDLKNTEKKEGACPYAERAEKSRFTLYDDGSRPLTTSSETENEALNKKRNSLKLSCSVLAISAVIGLPLFAKTDSFKKMMINIRNNNTVNTALSSVSSLELFERTEKLKNIIENLNSKDYDNLYVDKDTKNLFDLARDKGSKFAKVNSPNEIIVVGEGVSITGPPPENFLRRTTEEINTGDIAIISKKGTIYNIKKENNPFLSKFINLVIDGKQNTPEVKRLETIFLMAKVKSTPESHKSPKNH